MILNNLVFFIIGYLAYPYLNHLPMPTLPEPAKQEQVKEPSEDDAKRTEYVKECQRYGFSKSDCENIWDGNPV